MTEFKGPWEYRVSPVREGWLTGVQARAAIDAWMNRTDETGAPAFTMTRRPRSREAADVAPVPATVYLASTCDTCGHTLNWHRNGIGCQVRRCACGAFVPED